MAARRRKSNNNGDFAILLVQLFVLMIGAFIKALSDSKPITQSPSVQPLQSIQNKNISDYITQDTVDYIIANFGTQIVSCTDIDSIDFNVGEVSYRCSQFSPLPMPSNNYGLIIAKETAKAIKAMI